MVSTVAYETGLVTKILAKHWRICAPVFRTDLGVSRVTWRIGQRYWLSQSEPTRSAEISRQVNLVRDLHSFLKNEHSSISVPEIVPSDSGDLVVTDGGYGWCLTRNLQGFHPDSADPGMYSSLTEGLVRFHREMRLFSERQQADAPHGICVRTRQSIERMDSATFVPFTDHPHERELLQQAGAWILPRLNRFELLPKQIIHGDWTPRNVLFDFSDQSVRLVGVLDFEAMAYDPVHVDLASTCSTLLIWSGLDRVEERIAGVLGAYEKCVGLHLEREDIYTAMLAHWLCHYWIWRDRLRLGGFGQEVKERLCLRIGSVLTYVGRATVDFP